MVRREDLGRREEKLTGDKRKLLVVTGPVQPRSPVPPPRPRDRATQATTSMERQVCTTKESSGTEAPLWVFVLSVPETEWAKGSLVLLLLPTQCRWALWKSEGLQRCCLFPSLTLKIFFLWFKMFLILEYVDSYILGPDVSTSGPFHFIFYS